MMEWINYFTKKYTSSINIAFLFSKSFLVWFVILLEIIVSSSKISAFICSFKEDVFCVQEKSIRDLR